MNKGKLNSAILLYLSKKSKKQNSYLKKLNELKSKCEHYSSYDKEKIIDMQKESFYEYIGALDAMLMWGNKRYVIDKMISDNGFENLKENLAELLFSPSSIDLRWDNFTKSVKGIGAAIISELLSYTHPNEYAVYNKNTVMAYEYLEIENPPKFNYECTGEKYIQICKTAKEIKTELLIAESIDCDLPYVNFFLTEQIVPMTGFKQAKPKNKKALKVPQTEATSLHHDIKQKLVEIGKLLGFESRSEVKIGAGAIVDVIWEAKIGNMGKVIYVFEVQFKGSLDSLILNLKRAESHSAVQAVIAVSDDEQLDKILRESEGILDPKSLRTWSFEEVISVYDSLVRVHESINKLNLVPSSF